LRTLIALPEETGRKQPEKFSSVACHELGRRFLPSIGRGAAQQHRQWYNRPTQTGSIVKHLGEGYHLNWLPTDRLFLAEFDSDHWKTRTHQRFCSPINNPGAITLFQASPQEHLTIAKHLTAEVKTEEFVAGKGVTVKWERKRRQNHGFDALYNACAAGHYCGLRLVHEAPAEVPKKPKPRPEALKSESDHRPWIDIDR